LHGAALLSGRRRQPLRLGRHRETWQPHHQAADAQLPAPVTFAEAIAGATPGAIHRPRLPAGCNP